MIVVVVICTVLLATGATLAVVRAERGPSMLDRTVALDVFTTTLVGAIALEAAWSRRTVTIPILVVLSLVGFVSSVAIARFAAVEPDVDLGGGAGTGDAGRTLDVAGRESAASGEAAPGGPGAASEPEVRP